MTNNWKTCENIGEYQNFSSSPLSPKFHSQYSTPLSPIPPKFIIGRFPPASVSFQSCLCSVILSSGFAQCEFVHPVACSEVMSSCLSNANLSSCVCSGASLFNLHVLGRNLKIPVTAKQKPDSNWPNGWQTTEFMTLTWACISAWKLGIRWQNFKKCARNHDSKNMH